MDFTTEPGAELSAIRIENVTDTAAKIIATIDRVEGRTAVYLRYRVYGAQEWSGPVTGATTSATASLDLTDLLPDTVYEIEVSLDMSFPSPKTKYETFETDPSPSISSLRVSDITDTGAKVSVNISRPQPRMTVYLRHRVEGGEGWSRVVSKTTSSRSVSLLLEELIPETRYEVQASLNADFGEQKGTFFTTEEKGPSISGLTSEEITTGGVTVIVSIADPRGRMTVYLRTRETGSAALGRPDFSHYQRIPRLLQTERPGLKHNLRRAGFIATQLPGTGQGASDIHDKVGAPGLGGPDSGDNGDRRPCSHKVQRHSGG